MINEFQFLSDVFNEWRNVTMKQIHNRKTLMTIMYQNDQKLLRRTFEGWIQLLLGARNYKYKRELFYKKLLIFNYKYILSKYFKAFIANNRRLVTLHYKKEMANNYRSQQIQKLQKRIFQALKDNVWVSQNIKCIQLNKRKQIFKIWRVETRKSQLKQKLTEQTQNLNEIEQWVQQRRAKRIQPKLLDTKPNVESFKTQQRIYSPEKKTQTIQPIHPSINELNQYLELKILEHDYYTSQPEKNLQAIKQVKGEIKQTLEKIRQVREQQN